MKRTTLKLIGSLSLLVGYPTLAQDATNGYGENPSEPGGSIEVCKKCPSDDAGGESSSGSSMSSPSDSGNGSGECGESGCSQSQSYHFQFDCGMTQWSTTGGYKKAADSSGRGGAFAGMFSGNRADKAVSMISNGSGRSPFYLTIEEARFTERLYSRSALHYAGGSYATIRRDGQQLIRQILTLTHFVNLRDLEDEEGFVIEKWALSYVGERVEDEDGYFEVPASEPMIRYTFKAPPESSDANLLVVEEQYTGTEGAMSYLAKTKVYEETIDNSDGRPLLLTIKEFAGVGDGSAGALLKHERLDYTNHGAKLWHYTIERRIHEAHSIEGVLIPLQEGNLADAQLVKHTRETIIDTSSIAPKGGEQGAARVTKFVVAPGTPYEEVTTYDYFPKEGGRADAVVGRLRSKSSPNGGAQSYDVKMSPTSSFSSSTVTKDQGAEAGGEQKVSTTYRAGSITITESLGGSIISSTNKETEVQQYHGESVQVTTTVVRTKPQYGALLRSIEARYPSSLSINGSVLNRIKRGRVAYKTFPDTSVELYSYSLHSFADGRPDGVRITRDKGEGDMGGVTVGIRLETILDAFERVVAQKSTDIQTGHMLTSWEATGFDNHGRVISVFYDDDPSDTMTRSFSCCGFEGTTDRSGVRRVFTRDELGRVVKVTTSYGGGRATTTKWTDYEGLTIATYRSSGSAARFLVSSRTRALNGKTIQQQSADANGDGVAEVTTTSYSVAADGGRIITQTYPDLTTRISTENKEGFRISETGTAVSDTYFSRRKIERELGNLVAQRRSYADVDGGEGTTYWREGRTNGLGQRVETTDASGATSSYSYGTNGTGQAGKRTSIADADSVVTNYVSSASGRLHGSSITLPDNQGVRHQSSALVGYVNSSDLGVSSYHSNTLRHGVTTYSPGITFQSTRGLGSITLSHRGKSGRVVDHGGERNDGDFRVINYHPGAGTTVDYFVAYQKVFAARFAEGAALPASPPTLATGTSPTGFAGGTAFSYDDLGRLIRTEDTHGAVTSYQDHTHAGSPRTVIAPNGGVTTYSYDVMGRVTSVDAPDTISAAGQSLTNITYTSYTPRGQVRAIWGGQTNPCFYVYNERGQMTELHTYKIAPALSHATATPPAGSAKTSWIYEAASGRLMAKRYDDDKGPDYAYTPAGRLLERLWARTLDGQSERVKTTYTYEHGFLKSTTYDNDDGLTPDIQLGYDGFGRVEEVRSRGYGSNNFTVTSSYTYDPSNFGIATETTHHGFTHRKLTRKYDASQRQEGYVLTQVRGDEDTIHETSWDYDGLGRVESVSFDRPEFANPESFSYSYVDGAPQLLETMTSPVHTATRGYFDDRYALEQVSNSTTDETPLLRSSFTYELNSLNQRTKVSRSGTAFSTPSHLTWGYDALGQVTKEEHSADSLFSSAYSFDAIGNRTRSVFEGVELPDDPSYQSNALNQYTETPGSNVAGGAPGHDADGNLLSDGRGWDYTWDGENRLYRAQETGDVVEGTKRIEFRYDHQGRRYWKQVWVARPDASGNGFSWYVAGTTNFVYDGWNCIEQTSASNTFHVDYLWGLDLSGSAQGAGGVGGLLLRVDTVDHHVAAPTFRRSYPTYDGNGNVSEYLDSTGAVNAHFEYDAFGRTTKAESSGAGAFPYWMNLTVLDEVHRFSSKPFAQRTGLYYYGYRYYDPVTGRWPSRDPIEELGGANLSGFVRNSALNFIDVKGAIAFAVPAAPYVYSALVAAGFIAANDLSQDLRNSDFDHVDLDWPFVPGLPEIDLGGGASPYAEPCADGSWPCTDGRPLPPWAFSADYYELGAFSEVESDSESESESESEEERDPTNDVEVSRAEANRAAHERGYRNAEEWKIDNQGKPSARYDIFRTPRGDYVIKPKGDYSNPGEPMYSLVVSVTDLDEIVEALESCVVAP